MAGNGAQRVPSQNSLEGRPPTRTLPRKGGGTSIPLLLDGGELGGGEPPTGKAANPGESNGFP